MLYDEKLIIRGSKMDFKKVEKKYRPIPFWSWNEKLDIDETKEQIRIMDEAGIGGFFMHARGGLQTEYMSDEWFSNVTASKDEAKKRGMGAWAYDENGWPSGFGNGIVNGKGVKYQQKYLRMSEVMPKENLIKQSGNHYFYYEVNPFYVDTLDKEVISEFIKTVYEPYYEKYAGEIEGFFTDEPQISRNGIPWSFTFEREYNKIYNENILEHLEELFLPVADYKNTRVKFWKMVTDLFSDSFCKQIYDWCNEHNLKLTGHLVLEEDMEMQVTSNGACMPHYEYFHIPGMDWLGRNIFDCLTPKQVSSVSEQLGKKQILSETFAMCGHNISFDELKGIFEWQMVHGINLLCQHLEGYSLRGIRKRDYPPAMYCQQPWWGEYKIFVDAMSREGMILAEGEKKADVLLIHPQTTIWSMYDGKSYDEIMQVNNKFLDVMKSLEEKHIIYHLGDETIMERHAKVVGDKIRIGNQTYSYVLNPCGEVLLPHTEKLLDEFKKNGGKYNAEVPENNVVSNKDITYTTCKYDDFSVHYFVNSSNETKFASINVSGKQLDIYTGELLELEKEYEFEPWSSLMVIDDGSGLISKADETVVKLPNDAKIIQMSENVLTLDRCDYYFDGILEEENGYVLNIAERANKLERRVNIKQEYHITADYIPKEMYLVCETPEKFEIKVNGKSADKNAVGYFRDKNFKKLDISGLLHVGENVISFECDFEQPKEFYENLKKAYVFESEKNKLVYDMEIEAVYLLGDFGVKTDGDWTPLDKNASRYKGIFEITKPNNRIRIKNIEKQGFPFFCGEMTLETEIDIKDENSVLVMNRMGVNVVKAEIGGITKTVLDSNRIRLSDYKSHGKTTVRLTIINNLRNMLGPHHLNYGESYSVCPSSFFKEPCIWNLNPEKDWDDNYCFVEFGL